MTEQALKTYAMTISVKPQKTGPAKYRALTFKGIALAKNSTEAKDLVIGRFVKQYESYDGSSITHPKIGKEDITVKECVLYNDFIAKEQ